MNVDAVIRLQQEEREDGTVYVSSPDLPLFHIVAPSKKTAAEYTLAMLKEFIEANSHSHVHLSPAEDADALFRGSKHRTVPPNVIAKMAA